MKSIFDFAICVLTVATILSSDVAADNVVLTFDQNGGVSNASLVNQTYGDNVASIPDTNGHSYGLQIIDEGDLTPNVEVSYSGGDMRLWTTGYSDLTNVLYDEVDFSTGFDITFDADPGFAVGLSSFDLGGFDLGGTISGADIVDGNGNVLWSAGPTSIGASTATSFDTTGVFADSLTLSIDLTGLGAASDNIGIDNIVISQQISSVPEPTGTGALLLGLVGILMRRKRKANP